MGVEASQRTGAAVRIQRWLRERQSRKNVLGGKDSVKTTLHQKLKGLHVFHKHASRKRLERLRACAFSNLAPRPGSKPVRFGAVRFPASKRAPAKWACISANTEDEEIVRKLNSLVYSQALIDARMKATVG